MKLDIISIFPDYFSPLQLSLVGKAIQRGIIDCRIHDLRQWTHDRHRTVDDTPYGGGAGMVMKPEPWGEAFDEILTDESLLIVPTPSGQVLTQSLVTQWSSRRHMVFACGRYEGIDARVVDYAHTQCEVAEVSLGDYVLNGGEVAVLAIIETVVRLLPGVVGNPDSLVEESHSSAQGGLLEYPVYTKPANWRGLSVPEVLLSGHHEKIADWRRAQSQQRTAQRRPDLLNGHPNT